MLLQILWKAKLLGNDAIIEWAETDVGDSQDRQKFVSLSKSFVEFLKSQGEESDEEEEEEDEESD